MVMEKGVWQEGLITAQCIEGEGYSALMLV